MIIRVIDSISLVSLFQEDVVVVNEEEVANLELLRRRGLYWRVFHQSDKQMCRMNITPEQAAKLKKPLTKVQETEEEKEIIDDLLKKRE